MQEDAAAPSARSERRRTNIVVDLREAYTVLDNLVIPRLARHGHGAVRRAHSAVFEHVDDDGTTVSTLAQRARMTKQAMAELVQGLELHGYVVRVPDPSDRRSKLVRLTDRGRDVIAIAQSFIPEAERHIAETIGAERLEALRRDLRAVRAATLEKYGDELRAPRPGDGN